MTVLHAGTGTVPAPHAARTHVVAVLAGAELRRLVRIPLLLLLLLGFGASLYYLWDITPDDEEWAGAHYDGMMITSAFLLLAISVVTAISFHRMRTPVALDAPTTPTTAVVARFVATLPLVGLAGVYALVAAWRQRDIGGLPLGVEPGRTTEALQTAAELSQHMALAVLAVALGALAGRRTSPLAMAFPLLFLFWFLTGAAYWLYSHPSVVPFSVIQVQPVSVPIGPASTDPLTFPEEWLLSAPDDVQPEWRRLIVSPALAWFHNAWILGLSSLVTAFVVPRGRLRGALFVGGVTIATIAVIAQVRVIP